MSKQWELEMTDELLDAPTAVSRSIRKYIGENYRANFGNIASSIAVGLDRCTGSTVSAKPFSSTSYARHVRTPKSIEVDRQINRIKPYYTQDDDLLNVSIQSTIALLYNFASGPIPVPVASIGDSNSSLFFDCGNFYGDIEINGKRAEYYLKLRDRVGDEAEIYGEEDIEGERVPPKLLVYLYQNFAKSE
jgi:hypothetical protein